MLDTAYIGLLSFIILETINYIRTNWVETYNWIIYYLYKMDGNPFDLKRALYIEPQYSSYSDYIDLYSNELDSKHIIPYLRTELQYYNFNELLLSFLNKNKKIVHPVYFSNKKKEIDSSTNKIKNVIFLICFDRGIPLYYDTYSDGWFTFTWKKY